MGSPLIVSNRPHRVVIFGRAVDLADDGTGRICAPLGADEVDVARAIADGDESYDVIEADEAAAEDAAIREDAQTDEDAGADGSETLPAVEG